METLKQNTSGFVQWRVDSNDAMKQKNAEFDESVRVTFTNIRMTISNIRTAAMLTTTLIRTKLRDFVVASVTYIVNYFK